MRRSQWALEGVRMGKDVFMNRICVLFLTFFGIFPCLALAETAGTPGGATGMEGKITVSPVHGGPTRQGEIDNRPLAKMSFEVKSGDRLVTSFETDDQGHFRVLLAPGHYTVSRKAYTGAVGSYGPFEVDVSAGKMASFRWQCDTGLR